MAATVDLWTPPDGMHVSDVKSWRQFYSRILDEYGVTPADYRLMYVGQRGRCWICRKAKGVHPDDPKAAGGRRLGVDHNHLTAEVRGLLCTGGDKTCNRIIGWLDRAALMRAADYLAAPPGRVLEWVRRQEQNASEAGIALGRQELDMLAQAYLWPVS